LIRLDKNVFKEGLVKLQEKLDKRFYTTTLAFAHDLCEVINVGINTGARIQETTTQPEMLDASPTKHSTYSESRDRKRLGKRMLKSLQQLLQAALRAEADITNKDVDTLLKELDGMVDASLEMRQPAAIAATNEDAVGEDNQDITMGDAPEEGETIIAVARRHAEIPIEAQQEPETLAEAQDEADRDADGDADMDAVDLIKTESIAGADADAMDLDLHQQPEEAASIEVLRSKATSEEAPQVTTSHTPPDSTRAPVTTDNPIKLPNGLPPPDSGSPPPSVDGYSRSAPQPQDASSGPLTPPQSNGSLGNGGPKESGGDVLGGGGLPWYLSESYDLEVRGTTVIERRRREAREDQEDDDDELETNPAAAARLLSEELSEMDEETLKDLGIDVNDHTITASPAATASEPAGGGRKSRRTTGPAALVGTPVIRKGVRSSARRR
jgi:NuA3 HAT complex component NTO1